MSGAESDLLLFRVCHDGLECALVALIPDDDAVSVELEEIFVLEAHRGKGFGAEIIEAVVGMCRAMGYSRITAWAQPLDDEEEYDLAKERLINWYLRCGFTRLGGAWDELERLI